MLGDVEVRVNGVGADLSGQLRKLLSGQICREGSRFRKRGVSGRYMWFGGNVAR